MAPDEDWYAIEVTSPGNPLRFEIAAIGDATQGMSGGFSPRMELYDPSQQLVERDTTSQHAAGRIAQFTPTITGKHHIRVTGENGTTGTYILTATDLTP